MNLLRASASVSAVGLLLVLACCTKSDPFGKELFDDPSGLTFTDTLTLKTSIVREDSTNTSLGTNQLLGIFIDPVFGKTEATINTNFWPGQLGYKFATGSTCDSAFIYLYYDVDRFYGDTTQLQSIEVFRTNEVISPDSNYFSGAITTTLVKIGELTNFLPKPRTKLMQRDTSGITTQVDTLGAYLKIPIDVALAQEILELDSASLATTKAFTDKMRGLQFRATTATGCMMSFNLNRTSFSRMTIFFKKPAESRVRTFHCFFTANKWSTLKHDYSGTSFENLIDKPSTDNLFVQGGAGLKIKVELPHIASLGKIAVNQAELELTLVEPALPGDNLTLYPPPGQLLLSRYDDFDDKFFYTNDVYASAGTGLTGSFAFFGGSKKVESGISKYRLNLSDHLQDIVLGDETTTIYLNFYPQNLSIARGVFVGTGGPAGTRAKLNLKYSKIN